MGKLFHLSWIESKSHRGQRKRVAHTHRLNGIQFPSYMFSSSNQPRVILSSLSEYDEISFVHECVCVRWALSAEGAPTYRFIRLCVMSSLIVSVCVHKREKEIERERKGEREMQKQQVACFRPQQHLAFTHPGVVTCVCVCLCAHVFVCWSDTEHTADFNLCKWNLRWACRLHAFVDVRACASVFCVRSCLLFVLPRPTAQGTNLRLLCRCNKSFHTSLSKFSAWERTSAAVLSASPFRYLLDNIGEGNAQPCHSPPLICGVEREKQREKEYFKQRIQNKLLTAR